MVPSLTSSRSLVTSTCRSTSTPLVVFTYRSMRLPSGFHKPLSIGGGDRRSTSTPMAASTHAYVGFLRPTYIDSLAIFIGCSTSTYMTDFIGNRVAPCWLLWWLSQAVATTFFLVVLLPRPLQLVSYQTEIARLQSRPPTQIFSNFEVHHQLISLIFLA